MMTTEQITDICDAYQRLYDAIVTHPHDHTITIDRADLDAILNVPLARISDTTVQRGIAAFNTQVGWSWRLMPDNKKHQAGMREAILALIKTRKTDERSTP